MILTQAKITNFRLLHDISITFDHSATSIVGKNNSGKTSLSAIFDIFLNRTAESFSFDDFSLASHPNFIDAHNKYLSITPDNKEAIISQIQRFVPKIQLFLTLKYTEHDSWTNIKPFLTDLKDTDTLTVLFEYAPDSTEDFVKTLIESCRGIQENLNSAILNAARAHFRSHYKINIRPFSETETTENVTRADVAQLIQTKFINAQRVLDDSNIESRSKLSKIFQNQFNCTSEKDQTKSEELLKAITNASDNIDTRLKVFFSPFVTYFNSFGFPGVAKEKVELKSQLNPEILFRENIKLFYNHGDTSLPEKYNGLGYSNLICIIAEIIGFYSEIKDRKNNLNLIFIEEPEAHMHPQMQAVFVKNIIAFLKEVQLDAQIIITTHSPHILSAATLESIRYFTPDTTTKTATSKDLMRFNQELTQEETRNFLQQYLTLGKCDLFFADKAILFEGTTERLLLPIFISKAEKQNPECNLSEQYISSIEVGGAYMSKFKELLKFLKVKTLIITDLDSVDSSSKAVRVEAGKDLNTSNTTLAEWLPGKVKIDDLLSATPASKCDSDEIRIAYQTAILHEEKQPAQCGRSFEEAFILENSAYIYTNKDKLGSIKNHIKRHENSDEVRQKSFDIQEFIGNNRRKTEFAFDLLSVNSDSWVVPEYIKEGLIWLAK